MTQCHTGVLASLVKIMQKKKNIQVVELGRMGPVKPYSMSDRFNILNMLCEPFFLHHIRWCVFFFILMPSPDPPASLQSLLEPQVWPPRLQHLSHCLYYSGAKPPPHTVGLHL